jgi:glyoxylase-like metal-dependent hydrolase (beta-lactamase superfamily II)
MATHAQPPNGEISSISHFAAVVNERLPGRQLELIRAAAPGFRDWFRTTGMPDWIGSFDLISLPYPTRFGLFRAALSPAPFLSLTHRLVIVRWHDPDGRQRVLLFEPTDVELARRTPYFARLSQSTPNAFERAFSRPLGDVLTHLRSVGIETSDVDWITFDHLHTQDVRRWVGTVAPASDLSPTAPVAALLPNAKLVVQRTELDSLAVLHPLQVPWYQPFAYADLRSEAIRAIDGDVLIGPGVALLSTPGHTAGNHTLVVNTETGIWASSENVIATECLTPEHSRIPGVRRYTRTWEQEVVLNANTLEETARQYNSCVLEKSIVDTSRADSRFLQFMPSSELTANAFSPGTSPTFTHSGIFHGTLRPAHRGAG